MPSLGILDEIGATASLFRFSISLGNPAVNHIDPAILTTGICCGYFFKTPLETVIEARDFVPPAKITLCIKSLDWRNAFR